MSKAVRAVLKALSYGGIEVEASRHLANLKALDPMKIFYKTIDEKVYNGEHEVPLRIYLPNAEALKGPGTIGNTYPVMLFFHGGGWVTEQAENYDRVCARMAQSTGHVVVSVDYRLAPEHPFPTGLMDCYAAAKAIFTNQLFMHTESERITLIGDSAGGNLAAALCLLAKERGEFMPARQILIYPATYNDYSEQSPFPSVHENGTGYLLTARKMSDYLNLYAGAPEDFQNPLFAPMLAEDVTGMPRTLILTAEFDPLRDEGEAYGEKLRSAGNQVEVHRIADALHGYFALGIKQFYVEESFRLINDFLKGV